jgi:hypothetical protein
LPITASSWSRSRKRSSAGLADALAGKSTAASNWANTVEGSPHPSGIYFRSPRYTNARGDAEAGGQIWLLAIYGKSVQGNIAPGTLRRLKETVHGKDDRR